MDNRIIIAVDFDGTIVKHRFPEIGAPVPGAFQWLHRFRQAGAHLILWTIRCREGSLGDVLTPAVDYCLSRGIEFWGVNENPQQKESRWSTSGKVYAHCYVDDAAAGTPLRRDESPLPYVDWRLIGPHVLEVIDFYRRLKDATIDTSAADHGNTTHSN